MTFALATSRIARNMRSYRKRKRRGVCCVTVSITKKEIQGLVNLGYLGPGEQGDRFAIGGAVEAYVADRLETGTSGIAGA